MQYLLSSLRGREKDRSTAFTTIGLIAIAVEDDIKPYLPRIMEVIRLSLPAKVRVILIIILVLKNGRNV
jgi:FKBP12-rapamycin complex-associated protein